MQFVCHSGLQKLFLCIPNVYLQLILSDVKECTFVFSAKQCFCLWVEQGHCGHSDTITAPHLVSYILFAQYA